MKSLIPLHWSESIYICYDSSPAKIELDPAEISSMVLSVYVLRRIRNPAAPGYALVR
jgi:hypothetical protein